MQLTIAQVCTLPAPFEDDIAHYAAGGANAIEFWLTKLEQYVDQSGIESVQKLLETHQLQAPVASFQGGLFQPDNAGFHDAWKLFESRLALCRALSINTMVVAADIVDPISQALLDRVAGRLAAISDAASQQDVRIAIEFQSTATFINNLETTVAVIAEAQRDNLGICLDAYHFHTGPSKVADLTLLEPTNLFHVQLCDLADALRELASDSQRILPGEGDVALEEMLAQIRAIEYQGPVSLETLNPRFWQIPPQQFGEIGISALKQMVVGERGTSVP